eukprot:TRINITY_DN38768_c0_g2_i1.p2 TRINITY_DN38768_c0_g2~~TRINITY_DN38768_c0_g2_i1.p2  ORF type:complete len:114 (-),score=26.57 TRINITY_DN38768_c0_g2_i1:219-560(-)
MLPVFPRIVSVFIGALAALTMTSANSPTLSPEMVALQLSTPKPISEAQLLEFKQDFVDVDFNKDNIMDAQEVRAHFKTTISNADLFQFFVDSDKDNSGSIDLQEYVLYAAELS